MSQYVVKVLIYSAQPASRSVTVSHCVPAPSSKPKRFKFTFETAVKSCHHVVFTGKVFQSRGPKLLSPKSEDVVSAWNRPVGIDLQTNRTDGDSFLINCLSAVSFLSYLLQKMLLCVEISRRMQTAGISCLSIHTAKTCTSSVATEFFSGRFTFYYRTN